MTGIVLLFLLLALVTWLVYDYQIHRIDHNVRMKTPAESAATN